MSKAKKKDVTAQLYDVIESPIVTEKTQVGIEQNKFTFFVSKAATKITVKKAIEAIFDVSVTKVNIIVSKGKKKVFRGKIGKRKDTKKAIVTLAKGDNIDIASKI